VLRTPLCDLLGIDVPILNVGFAEGAQPELAAAVSNAGGCGVLGLSRTPPDEIERRIARTRELTKRPFGGNIIIVAFDHPHWTPEGRAALRAQIERTLEARIPLLVLFWGDPTPFVEPAHAHGVKLAVQVGSVEEAQAAADAGVDAVIVQGVEAGGHVRATNSIWDVLPRAAEAIAPVPAIAPGGIGDGAGIARALALGAQGVSLGTGFVATTEAWVHQHYKHALVESNADDTFYGELFDVNWPDAPHRTLKRKTFAEWDAAGRPPTGERPGEGEPIGTLPGDDVVAVLRSPLSSRCDRLATRPHRVGAPGRKPPRHGANAQRLRRHRRHAAPARLLSAAHGRRLGRPLDRPRLGTKERLPLRPVVARRGSRARLPTTRTPARQL
jgi:NAD(P)H-dependent flavin oxidoreductase YrpB (nitropropane dioxygenase family)